MVQPATSANSTEVYTSNHIWASEHIYVVKLSLPENIRISGLKSDQW